MAVLVLREGEVPVKALLRYLRSKHFVSTFLGHAGGLIAMCILRVEIKWFWLLLFSALTIPFAPWVVNPVRFVNGGLLDANNSPFSFTLITTTTFMAWVMGKSMQMSSMLGAKYGIVGGIAYAAYFTALPAVGICMYFMRKRMGYTSLPDAINRRYGTLAALAFGATILYRLYQEIWSNAVIVGSFYGAVHSWQWWAAVIVSTGIPAVYAISGGMRSALLTSLWTSVWKIAFLVAILVAVGIKMSGLSAGKFGGYNPGGTCALPGPVATAADCARLAGMAMDTATGQLLNPEKATFTFTSGVCSIAGVDKADLCVAAGGSWAAPSCVIHTQPACTNAQADWSSLKRNTYKGGLDLLAVALLQGCLSFPFHDPILTDRAFMANPATMMSAFIFSGLISAGFIILYSFTGIYAHAQAVLDPASVPDYLYQDLIKGTPYAMARMLGSAYYSVVNIIFIVASCGTMNTTFVSLAKVLGPEGLGLLDTGKVRAPGDTKQRHVFIGRIAAAVVGAAAILPLLRNADVLERATVTGTMVIGLGPPVWALTFIRGYRPLVFHLPFWAGVAMGVVYQLSSSSDFERDVDVGSWGIGSGDYRSLLGFNVIGVVVCWFLGFIALFENRDGYDFPTSSKLSNFQIWVNSFFTCSDYKAKTLDKSSLGPGGATATVLAVTPGDADAKQYTVKAAEVSDAVSGDHGASSNAASNSFYSGAAIGGGAVATGAVAAVAASGDSKKSVGPAVNADSARENPENDIATAANAATATPSPGRPTTPEMEMAASSYSQPFEQADPIENPGEIITPPVMTLSIPVSGDVTPPVDGEDRVKGGEAFTPTYEPRAGPSDSAATPEELRQVIAAEVAKEAEAAPASGSPARSTGSPQVVVPRRHSEIRAVGDDDDDDENSNGQVPVVAADQPLGAGAEDADDSLDPEPYVAGGLLSPVPEEPRTPLEGPPSSQFSLPMQQELELGLKEAEQKLPQEEGQPLPQVQVTLPAAPVQQQPRQGSPQPRTVLPAAPMAWPLPQPRGPVAEAVEKPPPPVSAKEAADAAAAGVTVGGDQQDDDANDDAYSATEEFASCASTLPSDWDSNRLPAVQLDPEDFKIKTNV